MSSWAHHQINDHSASATSVVFYEDGDFFQRLIGFAQQASKVIAMVPAQGEEGLASEVRCQESSAEPDG